MKFTALIILMACMSASATGEAQTVTIKLKNASLQKVFTEIHKQTGYQFFYKDELLRQAGKIDLFVENTPVEAVLEKCFENIPLSYSILDRFIVIKEKNIQTHSVLPDVKGRVINEEGEPVIASVYVKNTSNGTTTNDNGEFILKEVDPNAIIVVSGVGIDLMEIPLKGRNYLEVIVKPKVTVLNEIVVNKGYYSTTQKLNTGSVSKVSSAEIAQQPVSNVLATMHGRVPGLFITQGNGLPGSNFSILIRGRNSIQNGTAPLYVIDGIPFLSSNDRVTQRINLNANSPFNSINPEDIESIEVLKDADATAIYGSRGANGVILITTKIAKTTGNRFHVNINKGWGKVTGVTNYMNTSQYLQMRREAFANDGVTPDGSSAPDLLLWDTTRNVKWSDVLMGEIANTTDLNFRYSAGNQSTRYSLNSSYYTETTVYPGDFGNKRYTANLSVNNTSNNKKFKTIINAGFGSDKSDFPQEQLGQYLNLPPHAMDLYDSSGNLNWTEGADYFGNPYAKLRATSSGNTERLTSNLSFEWNILKDLSFNLKGGFNKITFEEVSLTPISSQSPASNPKGRSSFGNTIIRNWTIEPQINYKRVFLQKADLEMQAGFSTQESGSENSLITGTNYTNDALLESTTGAGSLTSTNSKSEYRYTGLFARINLNWDNKYLINITGRRDGSSRFGPEKRFANFGAIGLGWLFSEEKIFANSSILSYGKLRGSIGVTGNDQINNYQYLDTWSGTQYPYQGSPGFRPTRLFNPDYSWEQIRKGEVTLELGFLKDRIFLTGSWFRNISDNQIISYSLPDQTGFTGILKNFPGKVENKGLEFELRTENIKTKLFEWSTGFNITLTRNKLVDFPGLTSSSYSSRYIIGKPLNIQLGYMSNGVDPQTGLYYFDDLNNNGQIDFGNQDYVYNGTTDPDFYGGFQNKLSYSMFEFSILFDFRKQLGAEPIFNLGMPGTIINQPVEVLNRWQKPGDVSRYQRFSQDFTSETYITSYFQSLSNAALTDASYIRCRNVAIGYKLSSIKMGKINLSSSKVYIQGQNLFTITPYTGADPESQTIVGVPPLRMVVAGISLNF